MGSFKRLQKISELVASNYQNLIKSNSATLIMNYPEAADLQKINFPMINYESKFKHQINVASQIGLVSNLKTKKLYEIVIVSISKSRDESLAQIAVGYQRTKSGGVLIIEGSKRNGIETIIKKLSRFQTFDHIFAKNHGKVVALNVNPKKILEFSEWLTFDIPSKNEDGFYSIPGLFSYKKVDSASKFLSNIFKVGFSGEVIDLGAGWGFLSSELLNKSFNLKSVTLIDHDRRAIECAKKNIRNPKALFQWMDVKEVNQLKSKFDTAICNPPFHSPKGIDVELGRDFIRAAHMSLKVSGSLLLVSNIQLPYEDLLGTLFTTVTIIEKNNYFKIILAKRPKKYYDIYPNN